jgi:hypothetical protein
MKTSLSHPRLDDIRGPVDQLGHLVAEAREAVNDG